LDTLQNLLGGFSLALSPENLTFAFIGSFIGTLLGVLPGVGSAAGMAILLPLTFQMPTTSAIIMLAAIFYGSNYGGTITSVLMNVPGEASTIITCLDGHQMAKKGRAGAALCIAAIGSFVGGTTAVVLLVIAAPPLAAVVVQFGPSEYFSLMVLGLSMFVVRSGEVRYEGAFGGSIGPHPGDRRYGSGVSCTATHSWAARVGGWTRIHSSDHGGVRNWRHTVERRGRTHAGLRVQDGFDDAHTQRSDGLDMAHDTRHWDRLLSRADTWLGFGSIYFRVLRG